MADDALEYSADMTDLATKANRKMCIVGNSTQLTNLTTTYGGQLVYATSTGGVFTADKYYIRNAANSSWTEYSTNGTLSVEYFTGLTYGTSETVLQGGGNSRIFRTYTLPSTEKWYVITGIEWKNGNESTETKVAGVSLVDALNPSSTFTQLVALCKKVTPTGLNTVQRENVLWSKPIKAGSIIGVWWGSVSGSARSTFTGSSSQNREHQANWTDGAGDVKTQDSNTWTATTLAFDVNAYYKGYLP
jgi:hypothetical protein